jgi:predicted nucleic acid-binding protein
VLLADTSAWVEYLRATGSEVNVALRDAIRGESVVVTDPVIFEVMTGARRGVEDRLLRLLSAQQYEPVAPRLDWLDAAEIYRACRRQGTTIRAHVDCLIAAVAIRRDLPLLHADRDFLAISAVAPLQLVRASGTRRG